MDSLLCFCVARECLRNRELTALSDQVTQRCIKVEDASAECNDAVHSLRTQLNQALEDRINKLEEKLQLSQDSAMSEALQRIVELENRLNRSFNEMTTDVKRNAARQENAMIALVDRYKQESAVQLERHVANVQACCPRSRGPYHCTGRN